MKEGNRATKEIIVKALKETVFYKLERKSLQET